MFFLSFQAILCFELHFVVQAAIEEVLADLVVEVEEGVEVEVEVDLATVVDRVHGIATIVVIVLDVINSNYL